MSFVKREIHTSLKINFKIFFKKKELKMIHLLYYTHKDDEFLFHFPIIFAYFFHFLIISQKLLIFFLLSSSIILPINTCHLLESHTASQLRITDYRDKVNARLNYQSLNEQDNLDRKRSQNDLNDKNDEYAMLVCAAQSQPPPIYTWYRLQSNGQRMPINSILDLNSIDKKYNHYLKQFNNSIDNSLQKQSDLFNLETNRAQIQSFKYLQWAGVIFIRHFNLRDDGLYTCFVNNTVDEERLDTRLSIQGRFHFFLLFTYSLFKKKKVLYFKRVYTFKWNGTIL